MKKMSKTFIKALEKSQNAIAKERDLLDDLILEAKSLREDCEEAWHLLQDTRDILSKLQ